MTSPLKCSADSSSSSRSQAMMLGTRRDERGAIRAMLTAPAAIINKGQTHLGLVRDLSLTGVFFYTDFEPDCDTGIELSIKLTTDGSKRLVCVGKVVRVVRGSAGSALGVAVQVAEYRFQQ